MRRILNSRFNLVCNFKISQVKKVLWIVTFFIILTFLFLSNEHIKEKYVFLKVSNLFPPKNSEITNIFLPHLTSALSTLTQEQLNNKPSMVNSVNVKKSLSHITFDAVEKDNSILYTVLILISSHVNHRFRRKRIRESWGNPRVWNTSDKYKVVFVTGKVKEAQSMIKIAEEAKVSKDIISLDIPENFYLLAKKVIIGITWAKHNLKFKAFLKGDDDTFINIDHVVDFINANKLAYGYFGQAMIGQRVERSGRYQLTKEEHENDRYDPYCSGGGFIFTNMSVYKILPMLDFKKTLRIDDAYIGEAAFKAGNRKEKKDFLTCIRIHRSIF